MEGLAGKGRNSVANPAKIRKAINKSFKRHGLSLRGDAAKVVRKWVVESSEEGTTMEEVSGFLERLIGQVKEQKPTGGVVNLETVTAVIHRGEGGDADDDDWFQIIDSFHMPRFQYNQVRKTFGKIDPPSRHAPGADKTQLFHDRYDAALQRCMRHDAFQKPTMLRKHSGVHHAISSIDALLGSPDTLKCIFGFLTEITVGKIHLEDRTGKMELCMKEAWHTMGMFTWNSMVICTGKYNSGRGLFEVEEMMFPPHERRSEALAAHPNLSLIPTDKMKQLQQQERFDDQSTFLFLSSVPLDDEKTMKGIAKLLEGYSEMETPPSLFVLCGDFCSKKQLTFDGDDRKLYKSGFDKLAEMIEQHERLHEAKWVFVPGPNDLTLNGGANILPQAPLSSALTGKLRKVLGPNVYFPSNPCRILHCTQEIVVFRHDAVNKTRRNCIKPPNIEECTDYSMHMAKTVVDQGHLCSYPLVVQPIYWAFDHALRLYPPPTMLVMADSQEEYEWRLYGSQEGQAPPADDTQQEQPVFDGCIVMNPGEFTSDRKFAIYQPSSKELDLSCIPGV